MSYRVTNSMMQSLLLNDMHTNLSKLLDVQQQLSTQRKYQYASDNPNAVTKGMGIETMMVETEQYIKNLEDAVSWLKFTDSALGSINDLYQRIRELAIYAGDGALEDVDLGAIAVELKEIKKEMVSYANSTIGGEYLFSGLKTGTKPFYITADGTVEYAGNDYAVKWEFSRQEVGKVSVTGRELYPQDETTHWLQGIELPLDFEWNGRNEILEFKVGWQTVKVRIPERWTDEIKNGVGDATDYNRYRDPGELMDGYSLKEIADLINNSTEMGDVSKLLKAEVVTDTDRNIQYLVVKSHTGEPVRLTSWAETDQVDLAQGIRGAAYGPVGRKAGSDGTITVKFDDSTTYTINVEKGDTIKDIAKKLDNIPEGKIWATYSEDYKLDNDFIDIVSRVPGEYFNMEITGGATQLFEPHYASVDSAEDNNGDRECVSNAIDQFKTLSGGRLYVQHGGQTYEFLIEEGLNIGEIASEINDTISSEKILGLNATVDNGKLLLTSTLTTDEPFSIFATNGLVPLFSEGVSASSSTTADNDGKYKLETYPIDASFTAGANSAFCLESGGEKYWVSPVSGDMDDVKETLQQKLREKIDPTATVEVIDGQDVDGNAVKSLKIMTDKQITLSGFGDGASVIGAHTIGSKPTKTNEDHTHIGFAAFMGMETSVKSTEFVVGTDIFNTDKSGGGTPLHIKFIGGSNNGEIYIEDNANLTLEELAARINSVCGTWLQAVVETDEPDGTGSFDPLLREMDNEEKATSRLTLRTIDGEPLAIYDGPGKDVSNPAGSYAQILGINTALMGVSGVISDVVNYPTAHKADPLDLTDKDSFFEENMPAMLEVTVGERTYEVKVCRNNCGTAEKVAAAIVRQVNEQYGGTLLAWDGNDIKNTTNAGTFALYAVTGEPLRVIDKGYGDPRFSEYTGGVAMQLGIAAGITTSNNEIVYSEKLLDSFSNMQSGMIRISTPGHSVDIPVLADDNMHDLANRIRDYAGSWLDVSFTTTEIDSPDAFVSLSLAAKDGSALSVFDVNVDSDTNKGVASYIGIDTGLVSENMINFDFTDLNEENGTLTITINGASHTIDLHAEFGPDNGTLVHTVEDLADLINTRFQGQDICAEVLTIKNDAGNIIEKRLALYSPKGYTFKLTGNGTEDDDSPAILGFPVGNNESPGYAPKISSVISTSQPDGDKFGPGTIRFSTSSGKEAHVTVDPAVTVEELAELIRNHLDAGDLIEVEFVDSNGAEPGGNVQVSFAARDGSALAILDVNGSIANDLGLTTTGLTGTSFDDPADSLPIFPLPVPPGDELPSFEIEVDGVVHKIPLFDESPLPPLPPIQVVDTYEKLVNTINDYFQGQGIRADIVNAYDNDGNPISNEYEIFLYSPEGYAFNLSGSAVVPFGLTTVPVDSRVAPDSSPFNQQVTHRTGNNQKEVDFFGVLDNLIDCVEGGDVDGISDIMLEQLDSWMSTMLKCRAQVGALINRYSTSIDRLTSNNTGYTDLHTKTVGVDLAETITDYEMAASIYEASLAAIARIMQPSLLDFLS